MQKPKKRIKRIYIVQGSCGQYDDYSEWQVAAYTTEAQANKHRDLAKQCSDDFGCTHRGEAANEYDEQWRTDFGGTSYEVFPLELRVRAPAPKRKAKKKGTRK